MIYVLYFVHIVCCLFLILVVLLQQGKGADLSVFGDGATQAAFGARSTATLLHKATVGFFVLFILTTLSIGIAQRESGSSSIMSGIEADAPEAEASTEVDAESIPAPIEAVENEATEDDEGTAEATPGPSIPDDPD